MSNPSSKHAFCDFIAYLLSSRLRPRGRHSYSGPCHSYTSAYVPRANLPAVSRKGPGAELSFQREGPGHHCTGLGLTRLLITHHLHSFARGQEQTCFYHKGHPPRPQSQTRKEPPPLPRLTAIPASATASSQGVPELRNELCFCAQSTRDRAW